MATYLTAFNNLIFKFTDDLIDTFPEENDFKVYRRALTILKSANAKSMCIIFKNYSHIYKGKILVKDETFFMHNEYSEIKQANEDENTVEQVINKLKVYWKELSIENKEKIWKYLETLIKLSDLIS
jgi:uncharacterized membrane protein YobD (UPF0266 family)